MSLRVRVAVLAASLLLLVSALPAGAATPIGRRTADGAAYHDRLIVTWTVLPPAAVAGDGIRAIRHTARPMRTVVVASHGRAAGVAARLRADPRVLSVVPDARFTLSDWPADGSPSDPLFASQGDLVQIGVPQAWKTTTGDPSVIVAVLDTGVDRGHPDLDGVTIVAPRNVIWNSSDVQDTVGHGTHVSGTILAETDNAVGVAGIAPASELMPVKIADSDGFIALSDALDAVDWAREHGADIISMSFGGSLDLDQVALAQPTFTAAHDAGILMVAAAGNDGISTRAYPASFAGVISVSAVDGRDTIADFSNSGRAVDLAAPGVDILSTVPGGGYEAMSGTSMATPHVTGVAALVWAARPDLSVDELEAVLRTSAVDLGAPGHDSVYGDGRIDAVAALAAPVPDPLPQLDPPGALPALTIEFLAPTQTVRQSASTYTVRLSISHDVVDSYAIRGSWPMVAGRCDVDARPGLQMLTFGPTIRLTGLRIGRCYQVAVAAMDEDGNYADALSPMIMVRELVAPRIVGRTPGSGARQVSRSANVRVRFSEPVAVNGMSVRLRNLRTGLIVRTRLKWLAASNMVVLDPVLRLYPRARYRVEVTSRVSDPSGNRVTPASWVFTTGS